MLTRHHHQSMILKLFSNITDSVPEQAAAQPHVQVCRRQGRDRAFHLPDQGPHLRQGPEAASSGPGPQKPGEKP
jgi:hypothetical protein